MRNFKFSKIFVLAVLVFLVGACTRGGATEVGEKASDFTLEDLGGKAVNLSDFKGRVVILDFFATWCPPCRGEIPDFIELEKTYGPSGLSIIGVSSETPEELKDFAGSMGINYPVLVDASSKAHGIYGPIRAIPTTFIIDKDFKIRKHYVGSRSKEVFEADIKELLK